MMEVQAGESAVVTMTRSVVRRRIVGFCRNVIRFYTSA